MRSNISFAGLIAALVLIAGLVFANDQTNAPFADEIAHFRQLDRAALPRPCQVLFVGDSNIRLWSSLAADMAPLPVINRGFGGAHIPHITRYFDKIVAPYKPRAIVFYAGENDLAAGKSPHVVFAHFERFMERKARKLGATPVYFIAVNPSKLLFDQLTVQNDFNARVAALAVQRDDLHYIDIVEPMLDQGRPRDVYIEDGLHMTAPGYAIWTEAVAKALRNGGVTPGSACPKP